MTKEETKRVLQKISINYNTFNNKTKEEKQIILDDWSYELINEDFDKIMSNLEKHIQTNKFSPTIAELKATPKNNGFNNFQMKDYITEEEKQNMIRLAKKYRVFLDMTDEEFTEQVLKQEK